MKKEEYFAEIMDFLQRDEPIVDDMKLKDIEEWDSMARLSFLSFLDTDFDINITNDQLLDCQTVADLVALVADKLDN